MKKYLLIVSLLTIKYGWLQSQNINNLSYLAKLKGNLSYNAVINDSIIFTLTTEDTFLYDNVSHNAFINDGRFGYIPDFKVERIYGTYFKFHYKKKDFILDNNDEAKIQSKRIGIDLQKLLDSVIINKNEYSFKKLFQMNKYIDGASAETFGIMVWKVINFWKDTELYNFLIMQNQNIKKEFCNYIIMTYVTWPVQDYKTYYKMYYPKTWQIISNEVK